MIFHPEKALKIAERYTQLEAIMRGTRITKELSKRKEKGLVKQNQKEKKERAFQIDFLFKISRNEILMEIKTYTYMDASRTLKQGFEGQMVCFP